MTTAADGVQLVIEIDDKATRPIGAVESRFARMKKRLVSGSNAIRGAFRRMSTAGQAMANRLKRSFMILRLALVGIAVAAVVTGAKFQQAMANVASVAGASEEALTKLSLTARMWGEKTAFSATQAAEAMYALASAGQTAAEIQRSVGGVLLFAGAAATSLKESAEQTVQAIKMFGLVAGDTNRVVNVFAAGISKSLLTADRLKESLAAVGATANAVSMSLEETVAQIGLLHNAGMIGSIAGTRLKNVLVRLSTPNQVLKDLMGDVTLETHTLAQVMDNLANSGATAGQVFTAFGRIAAPAALVMMRNGAKVADEMTKAITGTTKVMDMYKIQMNTVMSRFKIFKSVVEENFIAVFMQLEPVLSPMLDRLAEGLRRLKAWIVGIVVTIRDWVSANRQNVIEVLKVAGAIAAVTIAFALLMSPVTWWIAAAALAIGAWLKWRDEIIGFLSSAREAIIKTAQDFLTSHGTSFEQVLEIAKATINAIIGSFVFLGRVFWRTAKLLFDIFQAPLKQIKDDLIWLAKGIGKVFSWLGGTVKEALEKLMGDQERVIDKSDSRWKQFTAGVANDAREAFGKDYVGAVADASGQVISTIKSTAAAAAAELEKLRATGLKSGGGAVAAPDIEEAGAYEDYYAGMQEHAIESAINIDHWIREQDAKRIQEQMRAEKERWKANVDLGVASTHDWLEAKRGLLQLEMEDALAKADETGLAKRNIEAYYAGLTAEAEAEHFQAQLDREQLIVEKYAETHAMQMIMLDTLSAAYDTAFQTIFDLEMTGQKRREKIWASMKKRFISDIASMAKAYISNMIRAIIITSAAQRDAAKKQRIEDAKAGAVAAFHAFAGIPIIGPALGAIAAAAAFGFLMAFHKGGLVAAGAGLGQGEQIAVLKEREYVVRREAVASVGVPAMEYINQTGRIPPSESAGAAIDLTIIYQGGGGDEDALVEELEERIGPILEDIFERKRIKVA